MFCCCVLARSNRVKVGEVEKKTMEQSLLAILTGLQALHDLLNGTTMLSQRLSIYLPNLSSTRPSLGLDSFEVDFG